MRHLYLEIELLYETRLTVTDGQTTLIHTRVSCLTYFECALLFAGLRNQEQALSTSCCVSLTNDWDGKSNCHDFISRSE